jgi:spermidine dehydrogenase
MAAAIGLGSDVLSAYAANQIRLPGFQGFTGTVPSRELASQQLVSSFPGGNDGIMRHLLKSLVPAAIQGGSTFGEIQNGRIDFAMLDHPQNDTRVRLGSTVIHVSQLGRTGVTVVYVQDGKLYRTEAANVIMANGGWSTKYAVEGLPADHKEAYEWFVRAPMLVVNVALNQWRPLYRNGITAASYRDQIGFSCNLRRSVVMDGYRPILDPDKPALITFYIPFSTPGRSIKEQAAAGRNTLLATTYRDYERQIRSQLARLFGRFGFDPERDIAGIILNRWGHAYVCPPPGFYFNRNGKVAPPDVIRQPFGRIAFANAELHGHQNYYDALVEGRRAAEQLTTPKPVSD